MPKSFTFAKEGILHSKTDIALTKIRTRWATFCQISYFNHEDPPTEENFIDFLSKKKESGRTLQYIAELYHTLCKAFHYLYGYEFKSKKVEEFIDEFRENEDAGICPHCGEVRTYINSRPLHKSLKLLLDRYTDSGSFIMLKVR